MEIQGYLDYRGRTDTVDGITHLIFIIAFYTFMGYRNVWYVHGYEKCKKKDATLSHKLLTCHNRATVTDTHNMGTWLESCCSQLEGCQRSNQISSGFH